MKKFPTIGAMMTLVYKQMADAADMLGIESSLFIPEEGDSKQTAAWRLYLLTSVIRAEGVINPQKFLHDLRRMFAAINWKPWVANKDGSWSKQCSAKGGYAKFYGAIQDLPREQHQLLLVGMNGVRTLMPFLDGDAVTEVRHMRISEMAAHHKPKVEKPKEATKEKAPLVKEGQDPKAPKVKPTKAAPKTSPNRGKNPAGKAQEGKDAAAGDAGSTD